MDDKNTWWILTDLQLYCAHPKTTNPESGEQELKKVGDKSQDNNDFILHNNIINA